MCAVVPLFLLLAPMEFAIFPWTAALFHTAFGIVLSLLLVEIMFFGFRKVPFTCTYFAGKVNLIGLGALYVLGFTMYSRTMAGVESALTGWPAGAVVFFSVAIASWFLLILWQRRRFGVTATLEYQDAEPLIRSLGLETH